MSATSPIYASWADNILLGAVITSTVAPSTGYALTTFASGNPSERVLFGVTTVTISFSISSKLGEILVIPMHNLTPGSTTVLTLTNAAGLSLAITIPALEGSGFPSTLIVDFSAQSNKTSNGWNLVIASNGVNVVLGGAIAIYPKKSFSGVTQNNSVLWQVTTRETWNMVETPNEYATPYIQDYGTISKQVEVTAVAAAAGELTIVNWFRASHGRALPGLLWPDPATVDAYYGRWQKTIERTPLTQNRKSIKIVFDEWPKGEVL